MNNTTIAQEESRNAERFRRLMLVTSAAVVRVGKNKDNSVIQVTIEASKGTTSNAPLRNDLVQALDEMLGLNEAY